MTAEVGQSGAAEYLIALDVSKVAETGTYNSMWRVILTPQELEEVVSKVRKVIDPILQSQI